MQKLYMNCSTIDMGHICKHDLKIDQPFGRFGRLGKLGKIGKLA